MNLTIENIRAAALGVASVTEENGKPCFRRFSEAERAMYYDLTPGGKHPFYLRALCSAGVKLCFRTDSPILVLSVDVEKYSSRSYFSFDVTAYLKEGENLLTVSATDPLSTDLPYGKQSSAPSGMWYTKVSGIWNFTGTDLDDGQSKLIIENVHIGDSLMALCYEIAKELD